MILQFHRLKLPRPIFGFGGILGSDSGAELSVSMLALRLDCSTAALATPQIVLSI